MSAEQLLEQMEIFEKAKNDFIEFEQSHQSAFKEFLKKFGFNDVEIKSIITGDNINPKNGEISARNEIITLFSLYNEISIAQTEKIKQINKNTEASAEDESKTMHFENLARTINQIPMDYYRKVHFVNSDNTSGAPKIEQEILSQQNQKTQNIEIKPNSQQTQQSQQQQQQQQKQMKIEPKQNKGLTITSTKPTQNIQITKNQNTPQKNQNAPQKNQNTPQKNQNTPQKNQNQGYQKKNNPQQNQNQGNKPKYQQNQPKSTPPQNQSQPKYTPPPSQPRFTPPPQQKPNTGAPLRIEKPNIQISTNNDPKIEKPTGGGKVSIQISKKNTGGSLFDKK